MLFGVKWVSKHCWLQKNQTNDICGGVERDGKLSSWVWRWGDETEDEGERWADNDVIGPIAYWSLVSGSTRILIGP